MACGISASAKGALLFRCSLVAMLAAGVLTSTPAIAQGAAESAETSREEPIVVTGTRLARPDLTATSPINIVSEERIALSGNGTLEQTLNQLPQLKGQGGATSGNTNASGVYTADLRGLGDGRTLVLVNGRRFVPANTSLVPAHKRVFFAAAMQFGDSLVRSHVLISHVLARSVAK